MVKLHLKQGDESLFLYETTCQAELSELVPQLVRIQNGRLKIERLFYGKYKWKLKMTVFFVFLTLENTVNPVYRTVNSFLCH